MKIRWKRLCIWLLASVLTFLLVLHPIATVIVYECIFSTRYTTPSHEAYTAEAYEGLLAERSDFLADGDLLAGYKYAKDGEKKGVVVLAHGLGGGHAAYLPFVDFFTENGYYVFAYDAHASDNSPGDSIAGLPQGVLDLDAAITHAKGLPEYADLPMFLFGHSWGAYSAGAVLSLHPDIAAAVLVAGFNASEDMLLYGARGYIGPVADLLLPYVTLYERVKFGEAAEVSVLDGIASSDAPVLIVQSMDDTSVPPAYGYDYFYGAYANDARVEFLLYEDRGHTDLLYAEAFTPNEELTAAILVLYDRGMAVQ